MRRWIFISVVITVILVDVDGDSNSLSRARLVEMLQKLCPGANVCRENQTTDFPNVQFRPGYESCCTECSCGPDCIENGNCCFPPTLPSQQLFHNLTSDTDAECIFPTTVPPSNTDRKLFKSYSMVTSVHHGDWQSNTNVSCGDVKVAPWGSLYPVYSPKRKRIYKNNVCALADDVEDGTLWDAISACDEHTDGQSIDASSYVLGIDSNYFSDLCRVNFIYQGPFEDLQPSICFVEPLDSCYATEFEIPTTLDLTSDEVSEACTSGLMSPYRHLKLYTNVFCHICSAEPFYEDMSCTKQLDAGSRTSVRQGFIGLIDGEFIKDYLPNDISAKPMSPKACLDKTEQECRDVYCPSGQLRDQNGECRFLNKLWFGQDYIVYVELTADEAIDFEDVFNTKLGFVSETLPNFTSPWQNNWGIFGIHVAGNEMYQNTSKLFVIMRNKQSTVRPKRLIGNIQKTINRMWVLQNGNKTYTFKSKFMSESILFFSDAEAIFGNHTETISRTNLKRIYFSLQQRPGNNLVITKLYVCNQVELIPSDFILSLDKTVLFNNFTKTYMYDGEFTLIYQPSGEVIVRVCIDDSRLYLMDRVESSLGSSLGENQSTCITTIAMIIGLVIYLP